MECIKTKTTSQAYKNRKRKKKHFKMERHLMENGTCKLINDMAEAIKSGPMEVYTMAIGSSTKLTEEEDSFMQTVTFMMVTGKMTKPTALDSTLIQMEPSMKVTGLMISNMEKVRRSGPMVQSTKVNTNTERKTDLETSVGLTSQAIAETLWTTTSMEQEHTLGPMEEFSTVHGPIIRCTEKVYSHGLTDVNMKATTGMTRRKVTEFLFGPMAVSMTDTGKMESKKE